MRTGPTKERAKKVIAFLRKQAEKARAHSGLILPQELQSQEDKGQV